jgi:hypothetical protein
MAVMTRDEAGTILADISVAEAIPAAEAVQLLRAWKGGAIDVGQLIEVLKQLRPSEVLEVKAFAERKIARRNRPR